MIVRILILLAAAAGTWYAINMHTEKRLSTEWRLAVVKCVVGNSEIAELEQCVVRVARPSADTSGAGG
jgi:hypothetical protein